MKTLLILRHAKSSWDEPGLTDHERPLNDRGKKDAKRVGQLLVETDLVPDRIVSSTALRARKTADKVAQACGYAGQIETTPRLYLAAPWQIIELVRETADDCLRLMIVGHNPGLEDLVRQLTWQPQSLATATLARVALDIASWQSLAVPPGGELVQIWRPKELD